MDQEGVSRCIDLNNLSRPFCGEFSPGVEDLLKFVSIALHQSVGEGDISSDMLSCLKAVGIGFEPLIYGLKDNASFESFQRGCEAVWKMEVSDDLPKLLVSVLNKISEQ